MKGLHLRLYTYENRKHRGEPVYAWLLDQARKLGIPGGSAYRAMAGYGRHGLRHEQHFFELAGQEPVLVEFIVSAQQAEAFFAALEAEGLDLFYACLPVDYGVTGAREAAPPDGD
jgi:PII-like signaling protein